MIDTGSAVLAPRTGRLLAAVDRFLPLVWLGLYALLPVSGLAEDMFTSWHDQERDLEALRSVIEDGRAAAVEDNIIGPAYIAAAALLHSILGVTPEDALVWLSRGSYALSTALAMLLTRTFVQRLTGGVSAASISGQLVVVAFVVAAGTWYWSDAPWSHFFATFLALSFFALRFVPTRVTIAFASSTGVVLALLAATRTFELVAMLAAWGVALAVAALIGIRERTSMRLTHVLSGSAAFAATTAVVYFVTGKRDVFIYGYHPGLGAGEILTDSFEAAPTFTFGFVPVKLIQLFVDPCYYALCELVDSGGAAFWRMPLLVQLPSLALLPLCCGALAVLGWRARGLRASPANAALRGSIEITVAASAIVFGYVAGTLTGSPHLKFGFARDFVLPSLLVAIVASALATAGLWRLFSRSGHEDSRFGKMLRPETALLLSAFVGSAVIVTAVSIARVEGLIGFESKHLGSVAYTAHCGDRSCDVEIAAHSVSGRRVSIPHASTLTFGCGNGLPRLTVYSKDPAAGVALTEACPTPRLVAAWPLVMGLAPDLSHLRYIDVTNAGDRG